MKKPKVDIRSYARYKNAPKVCKVGSTPKYVSSQTSEFSRTIEEDIKKARIEKSCELVSNIEEFHQSDT